MSASVPSGEKFGQVEPLTTRLRLLVHDYPPGIGIIKELVQNADDAGASELHLIVDWRTHRGSRLPASSMSVMLGPALLVCNDKPFTPQDFQNIQQIGKSGKARDTEKTGRFGLGFNTVYNITDWPSLLTGERIAFFDPHHNVVPEATALEPGRSWRLGSDECWRHFPDLMSLYEAGGLTRGQDSFDGTIFRFPCRSADAAGRSEICNTPFVESDLRDVIGQLISAGAELLLFLKNVERIRVSEIDDKCEQPRELVNISTTNHTEVAAARAQIRRMLAGGFDGLRETCQGGGATHISYKHGIETRSPGGTESTIWRVVGAGFIDTQGEVARAAEQMAILDEKAVPWAGAATLIGVNGGGPREVEGKAYCFLPLKEPTGLPVHVNGFFDLDSSRTAPIALDGQTGPGRIRAEWNAVLIRHVVSRAYALLIQGVAKDVGDADPAYYYSLWPCGREGLRKAFHDLPSQVVEQLRQAPVIRRAGQPRWAAIGETLLLQEDDDALQELLKTEGFAVPDPPVPDAICFEIRERGVEFTFFASRHLRAELGIDGDLDVPMADAPRPCLRTRESLAVLLKFLHRRTPRPNLRGLPLALADDGRLHTFGHCRLFLAEDNERELFARHPQWFFDGTLDRMDFVLENRDINVLQMDGAVVVGQLPEILGSVDASGSIQFDVGAGAELTEAWLLQLFGYLWDSARQGFEFTPAHFKGIPILPSDGLLYPLGEPNSPILRSRELPDAAAAALTTCGVRLVSSTEELVAAVAEFADAARKSGIEFMSPQLALKRLLARVDDIANRLDVVVPLLEYFAGTKWSGEQA